MNTLNKILRHHKLKAATLRAGDTLVEVTIALAILSMVLIVSFVASTNAFRMGQTAKERTAIANAAQGQMEALRAFRDAHDWSQFLNGGTSPAAYPGVLSAAVGSNCNVTSPCLHMTAMTGNTYVPADGPTAGPTPTSYTEIVVTPGPSGIGLPGTVTVTINYGAESIGGGGPIKGHLQSTFTDTRFVAPTPIPPPPPPCSSDITDIVLVLDNSSSMNTSFGSGDRMAASRATATGFVESVNMSAAGNHVAIVKFDGSTSALTGLTGSLATAKSAISGIRTGSGTKYVPPLRLARSILDAGRPNAAKVIVFVSDGEAHDTTSLSTTTQMVQTEINILEGAGTKVYTIGIGEDDRMDLLLQIMPINGGMSGTANEPYKLQQIYTNIAGQLTCL